MYLRPYVSASRSFVVKLSSGVGAAAARDDRARIVPAVAAR